MPFIVAVVGGEEIVATVIKHVVDRARPAFNPAAATLGPSFPSGHSTTAAAFYAAAALLLGRRRRPRARALVTGIAVGLAVAVASSRVLLDVHWLTDVIGGLALGWAWFALCRVAFGGRLLRFGVVAEVAAQVADTGDRTPIGRRESAGQAGGVAYDRAATAASRVRVGPLDSSRLHVANLPTHPQEPPSPAWLRALTVPAERWFGNQLSRQIRSHHGAGFGGSAGSTRSTRRRAAGPRRRRRRARATRSTC